MKMLNNILGTCAMVGMLLTGSIATAQQYMSVPYSMDFEVSEAAELQKWVLNPGATATMKEKWTVGTAAHSAGRRGLYISRDNGVNAEYAATRNVQYVYRDLNLPAGRYILSFDWMNIGSNKSMLSAGYALASQLSSMTAVTTSSTVPNTIMNKCNASMKNRYGYDAWQNASFQIQSNGTEPTRIFFVWSNAETDSNKITIGACIDNIQITSTACPMPSNLNVEVVTCDEILLKWFGSSADYQVSYRQVGSDTWNNCYDITAQGNNGQARFENMSEGSYDFRVRGICTPDTSAWVYYTGYVVYCPELHCVDFTNLYAPGTKCTFGSCMSASGYSDGKNMAYTSVGVKDYGSTDKRSRHTTNWDPTATDPRTNNLLPLVPPGAKASVRLGNWDINAEAESVSYTYTVDSSRAIVLLQYAVVLEDPDHSADQQPRFVLEILNENGQLLGGDCGTRNFVPQADWQTIGSGYDKVTFKPWTTVGLNVMELGVHDGDQITVRLTTYDCFQSGHYGYAYYTLDCAPAIIQTTSCAKGQEVENMDLIAPEGFKYQWYNRQHQPIFGATTRIYTPSDTATYYCRLTSTEKANCYFELRSQCLPRLPIPEFKLVYAPEDCKNFVKVVNTSHPQLVLNGKKQDLRGEKCDHYEWEYWGDNYAKQTSDRDSLRISLPKWGGTYYVKLTASLDGGCDSTLQAKITIPEIGDTIMASSATLCEHGSIMFLDSLITYESIVGEDTTIVRGGKTFAGCDSTVSLYIYKAPSYTITLDTVDVYEGGRYVFNGDTTVIDKDQLFYANLRTQYDCDSMVMQYVRMIPCYNLIYQRWDDVLSVLNEVGQQEVNPGNVPVTCLSYQWMKDHVAIEGETKSYYYAAGGLEEGHVYSVLVKLPTGEELETCAVAPVKQGSKAPQRATKSLQNGRIIIRLEDTTYDIYGNVFQKQ